MSAAEVVIHIDPQGVVRFIYDDELADLLDEGKSRVMRASHVEPAGAGSGWEADLSPVNGPVLGPFPLRSQALEAEVDWLERHVLC